MANYKNGKNRFLALLMAAFTLTTAFALTACNDDETDSSGSSDAETVEPATDTSRIKNGSFEYFTSSDTTLIATSVNNWSNAANVAPSGQASASQTASGIIDTDEDAWKNLTESSGKSFATEDEAAANWDELSANDKLKFIQDWEEDENNDERKLTDLSFYDAKTDDFNIEYEDVPTCANPGTHYATADEKNSHVLMIHNSYDNRGTAQKYTASSDIVLAAGTAAELSMWVKTSDLTYADNKTGETQDVIGLRGAYISITQQIGSVTLDNVYVKNIDTEAINPDGDDNGWVKYTFYLNGCSYAESTFKVVLGLGMSGGSNRMEYVSGYAFFDDVTCTTMRSSQYDTKVADAITANALKAADVVDLDSKEEDKIFKTDTADFKTVKTYAIDLDKSTSAFTDYSFAASGSVSTKVTEQKDAHGNVYVSAYGKDGLAPSGKIVFQSLGFQTANDVTGLYANRAKLAEKAGNPYLDAFLANAYKENSVFKNEELILLLSADGAAYTTDLTDATNFKVPANTNIVFSFFVKTSNMKGKTGLDVKLYNLDNKSNAKSLTALDTTSVAEVNVDSNEGADKDADIYEGWQQCFFFIENDTTETQSFAMTLNLGPKTVIDKAASDFYAGYAAITNFQSREITEAEYSYATEGTYTATITLTKDGSEKADPTSFDEATTIGKDIEQTLADLDSYRGVYGGSAYVNGTATDKKVNDYAYAGLLSKDHLDNYVANAADSNYWLNKLNASADKAYLEDLLGDAAQPLLIIADGTNTYGYIGEKQSISAGSYSAISVRVKASDGATAYVYLTDMDDASHESSLSIGRKVSYWYDKNGNICVKDPTADGFNKKTDIAFKLQDNGLYTVNEQWSGASSVADGYYANLANYEKDEKGNLLVAKGGVSYNYTSKWKNDGNDGIAFYFNEADSSYYADSKFQTKVLGLDTVTALPTRYNATSANKNLVATVVGTATPTWQTVTFFVKAGTSALNYRLEVWAGDRQGNTPNTQDSYVLFDNNDYGTFDETTYNSVLGYAVDELVAGYQDEDDFKANYANVLYDAFSFYDSAKFLRYDATADENEVGNSYTQYDATNSAYGEGVAYLVYNEGNTSAVFVNFSVADKAVEPDSSEEEDDSTTEDETTDGDDANVWLFASSIILAAALLLAVVSLIVRKLSKKFRRKSRAKKVVESKKESGARRRFSMRKDEEKTPDAEDKKDE